MISKLKNIFPNAYQWCCNNLPTRLMFVKHNIDSQHTMWIPRWGWSKKQIERAEKAVDERLKKIRERKWV